jgi:hypothetical protein
MEPQPLPTPGTPGRGTRLTLVALALLVLLALVAFASRSGFGGSSDARPTSTYFDWAFSVFLVLWVLAIPLTLWAMYQRQKRKAESRARNFKQSVIQNLLTLGFFLGVTVFFVWIRHFRPDVFGPRAEKLNEARKGVKKAGQQQQHYDPAFQMPVLYATIAILLALAVAAVVLHRRRKRRRAARAPRERAEIVEELVAEIGDAIDDLEAEPDARRAVIAAYARMEAALGRHGVRRRPSETPYEYLARVLLELEVPEDAVRALTDAFERAKFSPHEIDAGGKRSAIGALVAVRDGLRAVPA